MGGAGETEPQGFRWLQGGARQAPRLGNVFMLKCLVSPGPFLWGFETLQKSALCMCVFVE